MIFSNNAASYWDADLPVIPLIRHEKRPAINRWQDFSDRLPTSEEKAFWLEAFADGNIGMPAGPSSGVIGFDTDTDDPAILAILEAILPPSPWVRVGKKGSMRVYRYNGERTTRIKGADGSMICEILSKGTQFVLPPSIHPDTRKPYTANCNLFEVLDQLHSLPKDFEAQLRQALSKHGVELTASGVGSITSFVPAGARDSKMVSMAGLLSSAVVRGDRSLISALGEMTVWLDTYVEKVIGDPITLEKAHSKVVEYLVKDVTTGRKRALPAGWDDGLTDDDKARMGLIFSDDDESWDFQRIISFVQLAIAESAGPYDQTFLDKISVAINRTAKSIPALAPSQEAMVLSLISTQSRGTVTISSLKKQLLQERKGQIAGESHEEIAQAVLDDQFRYGEIRFDAGLLWQWKGALWEEIEALQLQKTIAQDFGNYPASRRHGDYVGVQKVVQSLSVAPLRSVSGYGLNFANGYLDQQLKLHDHMPDQGMIYVLEYRYRPEDAGKMPRFEQFLHDSWGRDTDFSDKVAALQEAIGASLMLVASAYQRAFLLLGQPGSGKSVLRKIIEGLLPPAAFSTVSPSDWGDKFLPAVMHGKVVNFAGELSEVRPIPGDLFKQIVSGDPIAAQQKNLSPFTLVPLCAQWFTSNFLPKTRDSSDGFNRRWLIFEFARRVCAERIIPELDRVILEEEREAIVAWAIEGFARLRSAGGYTFPTSHSAQLERMASDNNSVRQFLRRSEVIFVGQQADGKSVSATDLHSEYWSYTIRRGIARRVAKDPFVGMMKELQPVFGFTERSTDRETFYDNIGFKRV